MADTQPDPLNPTDPPPKRKAGRPPDTNHKFDAETRAAFLVALEAGGEYSAAAAAVGVSYDAVWEYRVAHPEFELQCKRARGRLYQDLLRSARKLAIDGVEETTTDRNGNVTSRRRKFDGRMILAWLQRVDRIWAQRVDVTERAGEAEGPGLKAREYTLDQLTPEHRDRIRDVAEALAAELPAEVEPDAAAQ